MTSRDTPRVTVQEHYNMLKSLGGVHLLRGVLVNLGVLVYLGGFGLFKGGFGLFRKRGKMVYSEGGFGLFGGGKWFIRGFWLIRQINQNPP